MIKVPEVKNLVLEFGLKEGPASVSGIRNSAEWSER